MNVIESAVKETNLDSDIDAQRPCFPRRAVDPDAALVEGLRRADPEAVEALVNTYGDRVYRLAIRITGNTADAEEVVQDALWTASRKVGTIHRLGMSVREASRSAASDRGALRWPRGAPRPLQHYFSRPPRGA